MQHMQDCNTCAHTWRPPARGSTSFSVRVRLASSAGTPSASARTTAARRHSTTRRLYRVCAVSALLDTVRLLAITKAEPGGRVTSSVRTGLKCTT